MINVYQFIFRHSDDKSQFMKIEPIGDGDAKCDVAGAGKPPIILKSKKKHSEGTASKSQEDAGVPEAKK